MAVAILALVIAMSSSATAALIITGNQIKNGSITGKDVKNKSLTGKDIKKKAIGAKHIKKSAIKSKHVKNRTLTGADIRKDTLTGAHLRSGSVTLSDVSQEVVDTLGNGVGGFQVVTSAVDAAPLSDVTATGSCPSGKVAVGANAYWTSSNTSAPQLRRDTSTTFTAKGANPLTVADALVLQVTCVNA